jgi:hypothetical protein
LLIVVTAKAQVTFSGGRYAQDFNGLPGTANNTLNLPWTNNTTLPGWYSTKATYNVTDGTLGGSAAAFDTTSTTVNNVGLFSFGAAGSTDRALGSRSTTTFSGNSPIYFGVRLVNNTGHTITRFSFSFTGEQWFESSSTTAHTLTASYQLSATSLTAGTWTSFAGNFTAPTITAGVATALDGNLAANQRAYAAAAESIAWAPGQELWIRIGDSNQSGDEHGLAIDNFVFWTGPGAGLFFNGNNSHVTMGPATAALGTSMLTLECWFMRTGPGVSVSTGVGGVTAIPLVAKGRGEADGSNLDCNYFLGINSATDTLAADFEAAPGAGISAGQNYPVSGATPIQMNVWHHAAATYDGSTWKLYLDGVQDGTSMPANAPQPRADSLQHFAIGTAMNSSGTASGRFQGVIDEVRVWNIARSPAQIAAAKNRVVAAPTNGLLARYSFDEGIGFAAGGSVDTAITGSLVNGPVWVSGAALVANVLPSVTLTSPTNGGSAVEPVNIPLSANAGDADGAIAKVEFFADLTKIGEDFTAPYQFSWNGVVAGSYVLTARVIDDSGGATVSPPIAYTVTAGNNQGPTITPLAPAADASNLAAPVNLQISLTDAENDPLVVKFYGRRATPVAGPDFTLVTLPDTQYYSENIGGTRAAIYHSQTQWIVDQRVARNIAFVSHMGDFVQNGDKSGDPAEWLVANGAMTRLEDHTTTLTAYGIPWGGAPGNHDTSPNGDPNGASVFFNQFFGTARFAGRTYYGGRYGTTNNNNNYEFFSASGLDFIVLHLAYRTTADQAILDWADALLKTHPNRRAIVTSHWLLNTGNPAPWGGAAQAIYEELKDNPNLFLMLCGHIHGEGQRTDAYLGRAVHSVLQDYQGRANGGDGWLRFFEFSPATNTIHARTYSTTLIQFETDADSDFVLPYDMQSAMGPWVELSTANLSGGTTGASCPWPGLETGKEYEWYATTYDGIHTARTPARRFTLRNDTPPTVALTAPGNNALGTLPAPINLSATATDPGGSVARVEFFQGTTKLGEDTLAPYGFTWSGMSVGSYTLTAVARDSAGNATLSSPIQVTVNASGQLTRGPYLQQGNQNSLVIRWRSSAAVVGRVRYGLSPTALTQFSDETVTRTEHFVPLTGLAPYTQYYYSVGSPADTLAGGDTVHTFRTSPTPGTAVNTRIWVLGDCGTADSNQMAVRNAYSGWTGTRTPDLCLMLGDNAYSIGIDAQYQTAVFDMYSDFLRRMPLWSCLGNHDTNQFTDPLENFAYFDLFSFPMAGECGGVPSGTEHYFSFDYGNIHFISLDSMTNDRAPNGPMATWLQADLASTARTWTIAFFHHPPYTKGTHDSDTAGQLIEMRENFGPILEAGGVDLVLTGHSHVYERSFLVDAHYGNSTTFGPSHIKQPGDGRPTGNGAYRKPLTGPRDHFGSVYIVTGSAGLTGPGTLDHPAMFVSYNRLGSFNLDIAGNQLVGTFIEADGNVTDTFTIVKQGEADSDGDGLPDAYEITHGFNRHDPADALLDRDHDGVVNLDEYVMGLQVSTPDQFPWSITRESPAVTIHIPTLPGRTYRVWFSQNLQTWLPASAPFPGTGQLIPWIDNGAVTGNLPAIAGKRFYRVSVSLP